MDIPSKEVQHLLYDRQTFQIISAVFNGIMLWDFIVCVPAEVKYIFYPEIASLCRGSSKGRLAIPSVLLLVSRLLVIPIVALSFSVTLGQPSSCLNTYRTLILMYAISIANGCAVFTIRTIAIRNSKWPLRVLLWSIWMIQTVIWFYWAFLPSLGAVSSYTKYESKCQHLADIPSWTWIMYLCVGLFDVLILVLTVQSQLKKINNYRTFSRTLIQRQSKIDLSQLFFQDTVMHFIISVTITLVIAAWIFHHRQDQFHTIVIAPIHVWLNLTISPRVIRSLKLHAAKGNLLLSDQSQETQRGVSFSQPSVDAKRFTREIPQPYQQPSIPFETTSRVRRVSAADFFCPSTSPQLNLTPTQLHFAPLFDHHRPESAGLSFSPA